MRRRRLLAGAAAAGVASAAGAQSFPAKPLHLVVPYTPGGTTDILAREIAAKLTAALKKAFDSKDYQDFMNARGFGMKFADGPGFASFMAESDKSMASAMKAAGLAKG